MIKTEQKVNIIVELQPVGNQTKGVKHLHENVSFYGWSENFELLQIDSNRKRYTYPYTMIKWVEEIFEDVTPKLSVVKKND